MPYFVLRKFKVRTWHPSTHFSTPFFCLPQKLIMEILLSFYKREEIFTASCCGSVYSGSQCHKMVELDNGFSVYPSPTTPEFDQKLVRKDPSLLLVQLSPVHLRQLLILMISKKLWFHAYDEQKDGLSYLIKRLKHCINCFINHGS